jgi:Xaa-Pro aminopeptidase
MAEAGIDALVAASPANVRYLTGYWCWLAPLFREFMVRPGGSGRLVQENYGLLPREGEPCLVIEPYWALNAIGGWVRDVRVAGGADFAPAPDDPSVPAGLRPVLDLVTDAWPAEPADALAAAIEERGLARSRLGFELEGLPAERVERLRRALPHATLLDCTNLLRLVRAVKTPAQVEHLARAAAIAEAAGAGVVGEIDERATLRELADDFRVRVASEGADVDHFSISYDGLGFATSGELALRRGRAHYFDWGCILDGWYSDTGTTLAAGDPGPEALAEQAAVRDAVAAGAAAMRSGVRGSAVPAAMREVLAGRGITACFPHGHGLGLEVRDYPVLMPDAGDVIRDDCVEVGADLPLEPDMVVNIEVCVLTPGARSVHCEQTFVVTADGARPLVPQDREAPLVAGAAAGAR